MRKPESQVQTGWLRMPRSHEPITASARPTRSSIGSVPTPPSLTGTPLSAAVGGVVSVVPHHEQTALRHRYLGRVVEAAIVIELEDFVADAARQRLDVAMRRLGVAIVVLGGADPVRLQLG